MTPEQEKAEQQDRLVAAREIAWEQKASKALQAIAADEKATTEAELLADPDWVYASKVLYEWNEGRPFDGDDATAASYGLNEISNFNYGFYNVDTAFSEEDHHGMASYWERLQDAGDHQKVAFAYLSEVFDDKEITFRGFGRAIRAMSQDPTNLATFGGPLAIISRWGGKQAAKQGIKYSVRQWAKDIVSRRAAGIAAADGAVIAFTDDALRMDVENQYADPLGRPQQEIDPDFFRSPSRSDIAMATGAAFGAGLVKVGAGAAALTRAAQDVNRVGTDFDLSTGGATLPSPDPLAPTVGWDPKDLHSRMPTMPPKRKNNGHYYGAPNPRKATPQARQGIIRKLFSRIDDDLAMPEKSFTWYEDAGAHIDHITRGDPQLKERMVRFLAIYSANNDVTGNTAAAIEAALQFAQGKTPHVGLTPNVTAAEIHNLLTVPEFDTRHKLVGNKIMNFYRNLHDPAFNRNDFDDAVTIDRHMLNMMGFNTANPTDTQYAYAQDLIIEMTRKYNEKNGTDLLPRQVQASLWTNQRNVSLQEQGRGLGYAGFNEELARATSHVTWEANTPIFPELSNLPLEEQVRFTEEARSLILDDDGNDIILGEILKHPLYKHMAAAGSWEGVISPNTQSAIVLPRMEGKGGGPFDPSLAKLYASMMGYIYQQDAVPWLRFDPGLDVNAPTNNQGWAIVVSESEATPDFTKALYEHIGNAVEGIEFTRINLPQEKVAYSFINFRDPETGTPFGLSDADFLAKIDGAVKSFNPPRQMVDEIEDGPIINEGELLFKGDDFENYQTEILSTGSPDLLDWGSGRRAAFEELVGRWKAEGEPGDL